MKNTKANAHPLRLLCGPIDWKAWGAEAMAPRGMKGRKFGPEVCAKFSAAQKARFAKQRAALAEAARRAPPPPAAPMRTLTNECLILGNMEPGQWYSSRDMRDVSGCKYGSCKALVVEWKRSGLFERAQNPAWKPPERVGGRQEPKWLYRLSREGEQRHRLCAALL